MSRILIVDDEPSVRALTTRILQRQGYETVEAEDGEEVLNMLDEGEEFSLIISDIYMPKMNGIDLLTELNKSFPHIPVIISSVQSVPETIHAAIEQGALYYLPRPFTPQQLLAIVHEVKGAHSA